MVKYKIKNKKTGEIKGVGLSWILREINKDRSNEWTPYNKDDWREGLREFTEWEVYEVVEVIDSKTGLTFKFPDDKKKEEFFDLWDKYEVIKE